jgi:hypothetical protein
MASDPGLYGSPEVYVGIRFRPRADNTFVTKYSHRSQIHQSTGAPGPGCLYTNSGMCSCVSGVTCCCNCSIRRDTNRPVPLGRDGLRC